MYFQKAKLKNEIYAKFRGFPQKLHEKYKLSWKEVPVVATGESGLDSKRKSVNLDDVVIPEGMEDYPRGDNLDWHLARRRRIDNGANEKSSTMV